MRALAVPVLLVTMLVLIPAVRSSARQKDGTATGTLKVGAATFKLAHAYAVGGADEKDGVQLFVTEKPLSDAVLKLAASAATNAGDRQRLALELFDADMRGLHARIGPDRKVTRMDVYSPDSRMGAMLLEPVEFQVTTMDAQRVAGRVFSTRPIQDPRLRKTIEYEATVSAPIARFAR